MATIPPADVQRAARLYNAAVKKGAIARGVPVGHGQSSAARVVQREAGWTRDEMRTRLDAAEAQGLLGGPKAPPADAAPPQVLALRRAEQRAEELARKLRATEDALLENSRKLETVLNLRKARVAELSWTSAPAVHRRTELMPLLMTSDFQAGEVIRAREIEGLNEYNAEVFAARYRLMIERAIDVGRHHTGKAEFPGFHYLRLGDVVSGSIHEDLAETNDLTAVAAAKLVFQHEREGIRQLRATYRKVRVISVNGNHDRLTRKPRSKNEPGLSIGTMLSWWLESVFENDANVTFHTSASADAMFPVYKWQVLISHGDRMGSGGGKGFIGPEAPIIRGHHQLFKNWSDGGHRPDLILTGHFHTKMQTVRGFANPSLAGYSEFARDIRAIPDAAGQWLLYLHEKRKVSQAFCLQLSDLPKRTLLDAAA